MRPIAALIAELEENGISLSVDAGSIKLAGRLQTSRTTLEELKARKAEAISHLEERACPATQHPAFRGVGPGGFSAMLELDRYTERSDTFDRIIAAGQDHFWDPFDPRYLDFDTPFDVANTPMMSESCFPCLRAPSVQARLLDPADRTRFINRVLWMRFSTILHGEQGGLNLSATLCGLLRDQGAQEFAANQVREEARHVAAFSRYVKARWGRPSPCLPALRDFMTEIIDCGDVNKKIVGMQIIIEGLAMGNMAVLYRDLLDPTGRRMLQLVMTDEAFHHRFGKIWCELSLPGLSKVERAKLEVWTLHCVKNFISKMNPPLEQYVLSHDFGLDPALVSREIKECEREAAETQEGSPAERTFRLLTRILDQAGLLGPEARELYGRFLKDDDFGEEVEHSIVSEGMAFLRSVHAEESRSVVEI